MAKTQTITGRLTMVQESRFRLAAPDGRGYLFSLSPSCLVDEIELLDLLAAAGELTVEFMGKPDFASAMALAIKPLPATVSGERSLLAGQSIHLSLD